VEEEEETKTMTRETEMMTRERGVELEGSTFYKAEICRLILFYVVDF
jgi:hypothetical protein